MTNVDFFSLTYVLYVFSREQQLSAAALATAAVN
jgi:hypothetical protein